VAIYDPGRTRTRMRAEAFPGEDADTLPAPEAHAPAILDLLRPDQDPSKTVVRASPAVQA
jgi:hypothetical protein